MDKQNRGSGLPSYVPAKRKRGRPRKYENLIAVENTSGNKTIPVENTSGNQTIPVENTSGNKTVDDSTVGKAVTNTSGNKTVDDSMVGKAVTGVVEGTFGAGYLLNVKVVEEIDGPPLRGVVFEPCQVNPITPENDVAPHLKMIKRTELPIPPLPNTETEVHGSVPSPMHVSEEHLPATEINSGISVSVEKDLTKNETSILSVYEAEIAEINYGISVSVANELPKNATSIIMSEPDIMSKMEECDKADKQGDALHELDASTQVKESIADGGVTRASRPVSLTTEDTDMELKTEHQGDTLHELVVDTSTKVKESSADGDGDATRDYSRPVSDSISLVQSTENTDKELRTEQQGDTLHELDVNASTEVKESSADGDGGATRGYSRPASDSTSLVQTTEDTDKELITEQQAMASVHQLDQLVHEQPVTLNVEISVSAGPEPLQSEDSEQISKSVGNNEEKQDSRKTDLLDTKTETDLPIVSD